MATKGLTTRSAVFVRHVHENERTLSILTLRIEKSYPTENVINKFKKEKKILVSSTLRTVSVKLVLRRVSSSLSKFIQGVLQ